MTIDVTKMNGPALIKAYNEAAAAQNKPLVKRFGDMAAAMKRTAAILGPKVKTPKAAAAPKKTKAAAAPKKTKAVAKPKAKKSSDDSIVRGGTKRDKLFNYMNKHVGEFLPISKLMQATYGESHKGLKGPLMMVMKGLRGVIATNRMGLKIEKQRKDKENHFGLISTKK